MLKTHNTALIRCPAGFSEEIIAVFQMKKNLKLTAKMTKIPEICFQWFYSFFPKFSTDFVN